MSYLLPVQDELGLQWAVLTALIPCCNGRRASVAVLAGTVIVLQPALLQCKALWTELALATFCQLHCAVVVMAGLADRHNR